MLPQQIDETSDDTSIVCCCTARDERCTLVPLLIMIVGLVFMVVGFAVPRGYDFDPNKPAREMEATENFYITLGYHLDICITVGMGFIALGGMIVSTLMLQEAFCNNEDDDESFSEYLNLANYSNYGTSVTNDHAPNIQNSR